MPSAEPDAMTMMMQPTPDPVSDEAGSRQVERGAAPTAETRIVPATGRKPLVCFGDGRPEKQTASYRPMPTVPTAIGASRKRSFLSRWATSARSGGPSLDGC
jgi:hypothetical protein